MKEVFESRLLDGKVALIAGGSSGINLEVAASMAERGANVCVISRDPVKIAGAVSHIESRGGTAMGVSADVRNYDAVSSAIADAAGRYGKFDIVLSGAAGNFVARASEMSPNGFKSVVDIDLLGTFNVYRASYAWLNRPGASLISISAPQSTMPYPLQAHVCAAKAGVDMLTRSLALEWGRDGIRVNGIIPGPIDGTEGMARLAPTSEARMAIESTIPLRRYGQKSDIANLALFLCSDAASYITGAIIPCDGGQVLCGASGVTPG